MHQLTILALSASCGGLLQPLQKLKKIWYSAQKKPTLPPKLSATMGIGKLFLEVSTTTNDKLI